MIKVIDNFLPPDYYSNLVNIINDSTFPWFYQGNVTYNEEGIADDNTWDKLNYHLLIRDQADVTSYARYFRPILKAIEQNFNMHIEYVYRMKVNMTFTTPESVDINTKHVDIKENRDYFSFILYLNDADGDTIIYDRQIKKWDSLEHLHLLTHSKDDKILHNITPKQNRAVLFNGHYLHEGLFPCASKERIVLSTCFRIK